MSENSNKESTKKKLSSNKQTSDINKNNKADQKNTISTKNNKNNSKNNIASAKGVNTSLEYDFSKDENRNVNDISNSDKVLFYNDTQDVVNMNKNDEVILNNLDTNLINKETDSNKNTIGDVASTKINVIGKTKVDNREVKEAIDENNSLNGKNINNNKEADIKNYNLTTIEDKKELILPEKEGEDLEVLRSQLKEKQLLYENLEKSNKELEIRISNTNKEYLLILDELKKNPLFDDEQELIKMISLKDKEIEDTNNEIEVYKKKIDNVKNKIDFKNNIEKVMSVENIVKSEVLKNKELKAEYENLMKLNTKQTKKLNQLENETKYKEKVEMLKVEIKNMKDLVKETAEKNSKQEKFLKMIHQKIAFLESQAKKLNQTKLETVKHFSKEDLREVLTNINNLKNDILETRENLKSVNKSSNDKINETQSYVLKLEKEYLEQEKINKSIINKRNELKRIVKLLSENKLGKLNKLDIRAIQKIVHSNSELSPNIHNNDIKNENYDMEELMNEINDVDK